MVTYLCLEVSIDELKLQSVARDGRRWRGVSLGRSALVGTSLGTQTG